MRWYKYVCLSLLIGSLTVFPLHAEAESDDLDLGDTDKQAHLLGGYALAFTATMIMRKEGVERPEAIMYSSLGVLALGAIKEYAIDDEASTNDQLANLLGAAISAGVVLTFNF